MEVKNENEIVKVEVKKVEIPELEDDPNYIPDPTFFETDEAELNRDPEYLHFLEVCKELHLSF